VQTYNQEKAAKQVNGGRKWCCFTNTGPGCAAQPSPDDEVTSFGPHLERFLVSSVSMACQRQKDDATSRIELRIELS
jgi:hypothetical protein